MKRKEVEPEPEEQERKKQRTEGSFSKSADENTVEYWKSKCAELQKELFTANILAKKDFVQQYADNLIQEEAYIDEGEFKLLVKTLANEATSGYDVRNPQEQTHGYRCMMNLELLFAAVTKYLKNQAEQMESYLDTEEDTTSHLQFIISLHQCLHDTNVNLKAALDGRAFYYIKSVQTRYQVDSYDDDEDNYDDDERYEAVTSGEMGTKTSEDFGIKFTAELAQQRAAIQRTILKVPASVNINEEVETLLGMMFSYPPPDVDAEIKEFVNKLAKKKRAELAIQYIRQRPSLKSLWAQVALASGKAKEVLDYVKHAVVVEKSAVNTFSDEIIKALRNMYISGHPEYYHTLLDTFNWITSRVGLEDSPFLFDYLVNNKTKSAVLHFKEYFRFAFKMLAGSFNQHFKYVYFYKCSFGKTVKAFRTNMILKMLRTLTKNFSEADIESAILKTELHRFCQMILETLSFDMLYHKGSWSLDTDMESNSGRLKILLLVEKILPHIVPYICKFLLVCTEAFGSSAKHLHAKVTAFVDQTGLQVKNYNGTQGIAKDDMREWYKLVMHRYIPKSNSQLTQNLHRKNFTDVVINTQLLSTSLPSASKTPERSTEKMGASCESFEEYVKRKALEFI